MDNRAAFLITVDTEGDNLWARPRELTTHNAAWLPRFQALCERYGLKPTYLTAWEMAVCPVYQEFARGVLRRGKGEVGMHLHAWNSPPLVPLTGDDDAHQPYLIEYPEPQMREKIRVLTARLEDVFQVKMNSHRAGRWAFNETYARILVEHGYRVDCSVTPHYSWRPCRGAPWGDGGSNYTTFPETAYFVELDCISREGGSGLLEVPLTVMHRRWPPLVEHIRSIARGLGPAKRVVQRIFPQLCRLYPQGKNHEAMIGALGAALDEGRDYVEFAIHSSQLMPGGSPHFPSEEHIAALYRFMERLFSLGAQRSQGMTLNEYYDRVSRRHRPAQPAVRSCMASADG
jgi:hypothetical protein